MPDAEPGIVTKLLTDVSVPELDLSQTIRNDDLQLEDKPDDSLEVEYALLKQIVNNNIGANNCRAETHLGEGFQTQKNHLEDTTE